MRSALIQGVVLLLFVGVAFRWPRVDEPFWSRATWVNLVTGMSLFVSKSLFLWGIGTLETPRLIPLTGLEMPLLQFLLVFLLSDLARYALHRAHHQVPWLWQFHRVHHSSVQLNATSGLRMHGVDFVQLSLLPALLFGLLLDTRGFSPGVWVALGAVVAVMDGFSHANLRYERAHPLARVWSLLFNDPVFHAWHHTADESRYHCNYGQALTVWDRLFGTAVLDDLPPETMGLPPHEQLQEDVLGLQLLRPATSSPPAAG